MRDEKNPEIRIDRGMKMGGVLWSVTQSMSTKLGGVILKMGHMGVV